MRLPQTRREKEIWHACETLWQQPPELRKLTGDAIQAQLLALNYKKGSPNEVYRYRKTWQETRGVLDNANDTATALTPPTLPDPINRAVSLVRDEIFSEAQQSIEKMTEDFKAERALYEEKIQALQAQWDKEKQRVQTLDNEAKELSDYILKQVKEHELLIAEVDQLKKENQHLEKSLSEKMHEYNLALEKITQGEKQLTLLSEASEDKVKTIQKTMSDHQEQMIKQLEQQHAVQIAQYQEAQLTLKDLMEAQRHQWIQQLDAEKTAHKKIQLENNKISQLLDTTTQELVTLKEKSTQYETLMEIQQLQSNLLSSLSEEVHHLEKTFSLDKIAAIFEHKTKGVSQHVSEILQTHFQQQNEWLRNIVNHPTETELSA